MSMLEYIQQPKSNMTAPEPSAPTKGRYEHTDPDGAEENSLNIAL